VPITAVVLAIAATTTMDATGFSAFSAFALTPLMFLFWAIERLPATKIGFKWGTLRDYTLALLFPIVAIGAVGLFAAIAGSAHLSGAKWNKAILNMIVLTTFTFLAAIVTEEGFFRGWLWGSLEKRGMKRSRIIVWTSVAFALWHISAATIDPEFKPPIAQVPIFLANAAVIGAAWGVIRAISGSILVSSASHGFWNGIVYVLFGFGTKPGALGITNTVIFGPEIGIVGLTVNLLLTIVLWRYWKANRAID
jgi:membrane protease YdiL (CAAX protease family)